MAWQQLHLQCQKDNVEIAEALLMNAGALSIVLEDAGDQPLFEPLPGEAPLWDEVILTAIFALASDALKNNNDKNNDHNNDNNDKTYDISTSNAQILDFEALGHDIASKTHASRVWLTQVADKDWEREWMSHYTPIQCANELWIIPKWLTPPNPSAINIIMDPGLAFGTGYHATTRLCLDWLSSLANSDLTNSDLAKKSPTKLTPALKGKVVIDYGCGSGILGIAALLLGAKHVYAVDIDPQAVLATQQNAQSNQVTDRIQAFLPEQFKGYCATQDILPVDIIIANILAKPLMQLAPYFATLIKPQGRIVLAGLIDSQIDEVRAAYQPYFALEDKHAFDTQEDCHWQRLSGTFTG